MTCSRVPKRSYPLPPPASHPAPPLLLQTQTPPPHARAALHADPPITPDGYKQVHKYPTLQLHLCTTSADTCSKVHKRHLPKRHQLPQQVFPFRNLRNVLYAAPSRNPGPVLRNLITQNLHLSHRKNESNGTACFVQLQ